MSRIFVLLERQTQTIVVYKLNPCPNIPIISSFIYFVTFPNQQLHQDLAQQRMLKWMERRAPRNILQSPGLPPLQSSANLSSPNFANIVLSKGFFIVPLTYRSPPTRVHPEPLLCGKWWCFAMCMCHYTLQNHMSLNGPSYVSTNTKGFTSPTTIHKINILSVIIFVLPLQSFNLRLHSPQCLPPWSD